MSEKPLKTSSEADFTPYPLAWLSLCFAAGILLENSFPAFWQIYLAGCLLSAILVLIFFREKAAVPFLLLSFIAAGALCFQAEKSSVAPNRLKNLYDKQLFISGEPVEITGILRGKPEPAVGGLFLEMEAETAVYKGVETAVSGKVRLFAPALDKQSAAEYERLQLKHGARLRIACELRREEKFQNPGVKSRKEILDQKEIDAGAIIKSPLLVENLGASARFQPLAFVYERRRNLIDEFKKHFSAQTAGVLIASLLGNRYHLDKAASERFREGGTFHVLVISGLQITFIGAVIIWILRFLMRNRLWQFLLASGLLWSYSLSVGAETPVVRAAGMFTILLFAGVIFRQGSLSNALGAAALILLIWRPSDLFDPSFQLTFACVGAIVVTAFPLLEKLRAVGEWQPATETPVPPDCSKKIKTFCEALYWSEENWRREQRRSVWSCRLFKTPYAEKLERKKMQIVLRYVFETILVSIVVQAWLVPFLVIYFHRISLIGIFLNVWVGLLMAIESLVAILAIFSAQISATLAAPLILIAEILNWFMIHAADPFIESGWASFRLPHYSGAMRAIYILYFAPLIVLTRLLHKWKPLSLESKVQSLKSKALYSFAALFVFLLLIIFHPFSAPQPDGRLRIDFLDVGQGDSALITMPTGETLLIDGGGKVNFSSLYVQREGGEPELFEPDAQSIGESVVSEFLWEKGYSQIDYILASHADADHIQGLADVAKNFRVRTAIFGRTPMDDADFIELYEVLQKRNVPLYVASRGEVLNFGEVVIEILYPEKDASPGAVSDNNHSLVLRLVYGDRKFLLTGDIERETESFLTAAPEFLQADVVKVSHHGSRTSSTENFVNAAKAKVAVISVGRDSPFGHPKPEVVERWKNAGAKVLTTGENGTISFSTDGKDLLEMKTFNKPAIYR
ncbi:MAG: ComEC/Rec2 family competence protein [Acidobacteriota bacterium]|nr:ComEC/Rec2 family competence protein [Acidobacteriota bacterium]